jgi:1,4-alpha-glucan branching enzyme
VFDFDKPEVRSFLLSSAHHWLDRYHVDGLRVDAVASMLYLDYSRGPGEWEPNELGGRENLGAIDFLRELNSTVARDFPGVLTFAEESTAFPLVSRPIAGGGLGFAAKWDMGWTHDTLRYMGREPIYRSNHQNELTFRSLYAFSENFVLPLSHDDVTPAKGSLLERQAGDRWQQLAGLRLLYGYQHGLPGKKLLFMGDEFAQVRPWDHDEELDWLHVDDPAHAGIMRWVADLNALHRAEPSLHELDCDPAGFAWVEADDARNSVLAFLRRSHGRRPVLVAANFTPTPRFDYRLGVPLKGGWTELLNSDADVYGGSGIGNLGRVVADYVPWHGHEFSVSVSLPPLGVIFLAPATAGPPSLGV